MAMLRAGDPVKVGDVTLIPIERTAIRLDPVEHWGWIGAFKAPVAVVVHDADGIRAMAADSSEIELDTLVKETPNLSALLTKLSPG